MVRMGKSKSTLKAGAGAVGASDYFVAFAAPLVAKRNEVLFVVTLAGGYVLRAGEYVSGGGVGPHQATLEHDRIFKVVGALNLGAPVMGDGPALIIASANRRYELPSLEQFAVDEGIGAKLGQKESADAAADRYLRVPVFRECASQSQITEPAASPKTRFAREFSRFKILRPPDSIPLA